MLTPQYSNDKYGKNCQLIEIYLSHKKGKVYDMPHSSPVKYHNSWEK